MSTSAFDRIKARNTSHLGALTPFLDAIDRVAAIIEDEAGECCATLELLCWDAQRNLNELEAELHADYFAGCDQDLQPVYGQRRNASPTACRHVNTSPYFPDHSSTYY